MPWGLRILGLAVDGRTGAELADLALGPHVFDEIRAGNLNLRCGSEMTYAGSNRTIYVALRSSVLGSHRHSTNPLDRREQSQNKSGCIGLNMGFEMLFAKACTTESERAR